MISPSIVLFFTILGGKIVLRECFVLSAMRETKEALENVSVGLEVLQEGTGKLNFNLSLVRTSINRTLSDPGCHDEESDATSAQLCRNIRQSLSQLQIGANFTRVLNSELI